MKTKIMLIIFTVFLPCLCKAQAECGLAEISPVRLYTPKGSWVCAQERYEIITEDISYYIAAFADDYPYATVLANASTTYNCHSYAWNMVQGGPICWLYRNPDLHKYWDDGSYVETTEEEAQKIFYYESNHSAVRSKVYPNMYESKWGEGPLMRHAPDDVPYEDMQYRKYYKCSTSTTLTSKAITTDTTVVGCSGIYLENIEIQNNAKLKLDANGRLLINGMFVVHAGSQLEIE